MLNIHLTTQNKKTVLCQHLISSDSMPLQNCLDGRVVVSPSSCYPPPGTFPLPLHAFPILSDKGRHHSDAAWSLVKWFIMHTWTLPLVNSKYSIGLVGSSTSRVLSSPTTIPRNTPMHLMTSQDSSQRRGLCHNSSSSCCFSGSKVLCSFSFFHHLPQI